MAVLEQIPGNAKSILDVGCGAGDNARILKRLNKEVACITISEEEALLAKEICDEVITGNVESGELNITKKFDAIILSHVCEHLVDPAGTINKLSGHLREKGIAVVALPNMAFYKNRLRLLKGNWTMKDSGPFDRTHLHFYSYHSANEVCDEHRMRIIKKLPGDLAIPLWPLRKLWPSLCKKIDEAIGKYFPNLFAQQVILVIETNNKTAKSI